MVRPVNIMPLEEYLERIDPINEAEFTKMVMNEAREQGWSPYWVFDSRKSTTAGFPDLVIIHPDHPCPVFAELKMKGNYPTASQRYWLEILTDSGQRVFVWRPENWKEIKEVLRGGDAPGYSVVMAKQAKRKKRE